MSIIAQFKNKKTKKDEKQTMKRCTMGEKTNPNRNQCTYINSKHITLKIFKDH